MANAQLGTVLRHLRTLVDEKTAEDASDGELLKRFVTHQEQSAFVALLKRHGPMVYGVCRRIGRNEHDAEDAFQATFLILARKARSIRNHVSIAGWLYAVAHRLILQTKGRERRREARERQAVDMRKTSSTSNAAWQELQAILDDALAEVPPTYRAPLLLCYLEGKTQEEAARQLGCPLGTVRSRLARGRSRLKKLLERRGIRLSATALTTALLANDLSAAMPAELLAATAQASLGYVAGTAPATLVSARVVSLLEGGLRAMTLSNLKIATVAMLFLLGAVGLGTRACLAYVAAGAPAQADKTGMAMKPDRNAAAASRGQDDLGSLTLRGRVLTSEGKPASAAKLFLIRNGTAPVELGITAGDGSFTVVIKDKHKSDVVGARVQGEGLDFISCANVKNEAAVELRTVKDNAIRGRIVDTQGQPVSGVELHLTSLGIDAGDTLDKFLDKWKRSTPNVGWYASDKQMWCQSDSFPVAISDADGRFTVIGIGAERLVNLRLSKPGIAEARMLVANRPGLDAKAYNDAQLKNEPGYGAPPKRMGVYRTLGLSGPDVALIVETEKPIGGIVKDADTGKPVAGIAVSLAINDDDASRLYPQYAKTDAAGRYAIRGCHKAKLYTLHIENPFTGYLRCEVQVADTPGYEPIAVDIGLVKGVVITGRILDAATGKPLRGQTIVGPLSDNHFVKNRPEFNTNIVDYVPFTTDADGSFHRVTIPGRILLMGGASQTEDIMRYKPAVPDPKYPQYFFTEPQLPGVVMCSAAGGALPFLQGNFCKVLDIPPGTTLIKQDILLEPASALPVHVQDGEGRPLTGTWVTGMSPVNFAIPLHIEQDHCAAYHLQPGKPRLMVFWEPNKKLAGTLKLKGNEKDPMVVKLGAAGAVKGRLLDDAGKPLANFSVDTLYPERTAHELYHRMHNDGSKVSTDENGIFRLIDLIPGTGFKLHHPGWEKPFVDRSIIVQPAQTLDLGDVKVKMQREPEGE